MTSLERLVPPLELCRRLKEAEFPQGDSAFSWVFQNRDGTWELWITAGWTGSRHPTEVVAAPTFEEIWERLPTRLAFNVRLCAMTVAGNESVGYLWLPSLDKWRIRFEGSCSAAAELWLWCAENGHLEGAEDGG